MASAKPRGHRTNKPLPQRADARRNVEAILDAAERCLARNADASMADIADEAGLGRVTIYGHFETRAELIEVVVRRVLEQANTILGGVDLSGPADEALCRLVEASWQVTARSGSLLVAAEKALSPQAVRAAHAGELEARVRQFLSRAQQSGAFRNDLSIDWLVATFHATLHAAANEIDAGRLRGDAAARVISSTLLGAYRPSPSRPARGRPPLRPRQSAKRSAEG